MMFVEGRLTRPDWSEADVAGSRRQGRRRQGGGLATIPIASAEPENCE
jgi:hypothetical protein